MEDLFSDLKNNLGPEKAKELQEFMDMVKSDVPLSEEIESYVYYIVEDIMQRAQSNTGATIERDIYASILTGMIIYRNFLIGKGIFELGE